MLSYPVFTFTKNLILFTKIIDTQKNELSVEQIYHRSNYTLRRLTRHDEAYTRDAKFQAIFNNNQTYNLKVDVWNGILLRIIHKRYTIQKHWEWYWKTILAILFGAAITYFSTKLSYKEGYKDGLKEGSKGEFKSDTNH